MSSLTCPNALLVSKYNTGKRNPVRANTRRSVQPRTDLALQVLVDGDFARQLFPIVRLLVVVRREGDVFKDERPDRAESDRLKLELFPLDLDQPHVPATSCSVRDLIE